MSFFRAASLLALSSLSLIASSGCAEAECKYNSDCAAGLCINGTCERECFAAIDCPKERPSCVRGTCAASTTDSGVPTTDSGEKDSTPIDSGTPDTTIDDTSVPPPDTEPPPDTSVPPTDTSTGGKSYLTACTADTECASGKCTTSAPRFCSKSCSSHAECAHGQICGGGICRIDDTGTPCTSAASCLEYCGGIAGASHCTHSCSTGADCPAGFACASAGGVKICVNIEKPCSVATDCPTGLGFCGSTGLGCTSECTSDAECPSHWVGVPGYRCQSSSGKMVCVPPTAVIGSSPMGATCSTTGTNLCRSEVCDDGTSPATCIQRCTLRGGCPTGWGCYPLEDPSGTALICSAAGGAWLGSSCIRGRDCASGICQSPGYCTRMCSDGYCPDGMTCTGTGLTATDGTAIKLCQK